MAAILPLGAGTVIGGHYSIEGLINTGGFGSVYRGVALSDGNRPCAIKETYDVTPVARRQALMEAAILFTVKSDHLPQIYDAFEENARFYLVMQLIEGQNCLQLVKGHGGPFSEQEVCNWLLPIADTLQELHGRNPPVLHRDIKPANIILTPASCAVLVDFGLTRLYDPGKQTQTIVRAVSEGFSPLEQYIGQTSPQSDVYSLAATIYFLLTARVPPTAVARSITDALVPPRQLNPQLSPKVERVLLKAMAVNADQRYNSMQEFARALRAPGFVGHAEPTLSSARYQEANALTEAASVPAWQGGNQAQIYQSSPQNPQPVPAYRALPPPARVGRAIPPPAQVRRAIPPPAGGSFNPAYPVSAQAPRSLPGAGNQGCLWGLLQGVASALLLLVFKQEFFFFLGILEGLFFYALAGFFTTRRGGRAVRSLWAGIWAGIVSTVCFWVVLLIGVTVQAGRLIQEAQKEGKILAFSRALERVSPTFLTQNSSTDAHQGGANLLLYAVVGLACAMGFALLGGLLGSRSYRSRPRPHP